MTVLDKITGCLRRSTAFERYLHLLKQPADYWKEHFDNFLLLTRLSLRRV